MMVLLSVLMSAGHYSESFHVQFHRLLLLLPWDFVSPGSLHLSPCGSEDGSERSFSSGELLFSVFHRRFDDIGGTIQSFKGSAPLLRSSEVSGRTLREGSVERTEYRH